MLRKITQDRCYHFENRENNEHDLVLRKAHAMHPASDLRQSRYPASAPSSVRRRTAGRKWGGGPRPSSTGRGRNGWVRRCWDGWALSWGRAAARNRERGCRRSRASVGTPEPPLLSPRTPLSPSRRTRPRRGLQGLARPSEPDESLPWVKKKKKAAPSEQPLSPIKMEEISLANLDTNKLEAIAQEIYVDLIEDSCLGFCFEVHRAVKCGYFYLEFADTGSVKDFGIQPVEDKGARRLPLCSLPGDPGNGPQPELQRSPPEFQ